MNEKDRFTFAVWQSAEVAARNGKLAGLGTVAFRNGIVREARRDRSGSKEGILYAMFCSERGCNSNGSFGPSNRSLPATSLQADVDGILVIV